MLHIFIVECDGKNCENAEKEEDEAISLAIYSDKEVLVEKDVNSSRSLGEN